nr:ferrochelatase [Tanacetum cinerariifolium]
MINFYHLLAAHPDIEPEKMLVENKFYLDNINAEVKTPPDIIVVDDNDDFIDDEDGVPHDLADFDDEVLANAEDDDEAATVIYSSDEEVY